MIDEPARRIVPNNAGGITINLVGGVLPEELRVVLAGEPGMDFIALEIGGKIRDTGDRINQLYLLPGAAAAQLVRRIVEQVAGAPGHLSSLAFAAYLAEHPLPTIGGDHG